MKAIRGAQKELNDNFKKIRTTPAGFDFFVSIHDFIEFIELHPSFKIFFGKKAARAKEMPKKYFSLKQIHQGIKDIDGKSTADLGHDRYVAIRELSLIRNKDLSEGNSFWKRREVFRKLTAEVHETLDAYLSA